MSRKLHNIRIFQSQNLLEPSADVLEDFLALGWGAAVLFTRDALAHCPGPKTDTVESLAHVDNNAHNLIVTIIL